MCDMLGKLDPAVTTDASDVIAKLEDTEKGVRRAALWTLRKLDLAVHATHAPAVITKLEHEDSKSETFILSGSFKIRSIGRDLAPQVGSMCERFPSERKVE